MLSKPGELFWKFVRLCSEKCSSFERTEETLACLYGIDIRTAVAMNRNKAMMTVRHYRDILEKQPTFKLPGVVEDCADVLEVDLTTDESKHLMNAGRVLALAGRTVANSHLDPESCVRWELQWLLEEIHASYEPYENNVKLLKRSTLAESKDILSRMTPHDVKWTAHFWCQSGDLKKKDRKIFDLMTPERHAALCAGVR